MEAFIVDKTFYDIGDDSDLRELWDTELDSSMHDALKGSDSEAEWGALLDVKPEVILHDRLMTDAALGPAPIKTEHSYSLASDGDSVPDSPLSLQNRMDDMETECFPAIPLNSATSRPTVVSVKSEPLSAPSSPDPSRLSPDLPHALAVTLRSEHLTSPVKTSGQQSLLKQPTILLASRTGLLSQQSRVVFPKLNIKLEPNNGTTFSLPPTPPSSTTSDSEGNVSPVHHPPSPAAPRTVRQSTTTRLLVSAPSRQPIQTPLISSQPKGSTGLLMLTEEEKRTLLAEGYPIPTRLPLTKSEEKSLKKIRRKIKNKISAQESRRKKKEYMDALEKKVEALSSDNKEYRRRIETLECNNTSLLSQLHKLQNLVGGAAASVSECRTATTQTQHLTSAAILAAASVSSPSSVDEDEYCEVVDIMGDC